MTRTAKGKDPAWLVEINAALAVSVSEVDPAEWVFGYVRISREELGIYNPIAAVVLPILYAFGASFSPVKT